MKSIKFDVRLEGIDLIALCQHQQYNQWLILLVFIPELDMYKTGVWSTKRNRWVSSEDHKYANNAWFRFVQRSTTSTILGGEDASN